MAFSRFLLARRLDALVLAALACPWLAGCMATNASHPETLPDPAVIAAAEDPDPATDTGQDEPQFCNPSGKQGAELAQCNKHNEALNQSFDEAAKQREPWFNFTPDSWVSSQELDAKYVVPVVRQAEAVKELEKTPLIALTSPEVEYYTGKKESFPGLQAYLVRGLMYFQQTGSFSVFEKGEAIFVRHDSIGDLTPDEKRTGVVVFLSFKPKDVYVDCQVAD